MFKQVSLATVFSVGAVVMVQTVGMVTMFFSHQSSPIVVDIQLGHLAMGQVMCIISLLALVTVLVLIPLDYMWWQLLSWV